MNTLDMRDNLAKDNDNSEKVQAKDPAHPITIPNLESNEIYQKKYWSSFPMIIGINDPRISVNKR